jgi:hypothetical protein
MQFPEISEEPTGQLQVVPERTLGLTQVEHPFEVVSVQVAQVAWHAYFDYFNS